jgi:hypothetical protein
VENRILDGQVEPMTGVIVLHTARGHLSRAPPGASLMSQIHGTTRCNVSDQNQHMR